MTKRFIAIITALILAVMPLFTVVTSYADVTFKYTVSGGKVTITGCEGTPEGELVIPETIEGKPVVNIGDYAFQECTGITGVSMPSVENVGEMAFYWCSGITYLDMPVLKSAGYMAFADCTSLTDVNAPALREIGTWSFFMCSALESVEFPSVTFVGMEAFADDAALKTVAMPNVNQIDGSAFARCVSLESIDISNVGEIGDSIFEHCSSLSEIIISDTNESFCADGGMLMNKARTSLIAYPGAAGEIRLPDSIEKIEYKAFYYAPLTAVDMPCVEVVGSYAFFMCASLGTVLMPEVTTVGSCAFNCCGALTSVDMQSVQSIGYFAFGDGYVISAAYLYTDAPAEFDDYAFYGHTDDFRIYYAQGTSGYTEVWHDYLTQEFVPVKVTFVDSVTDTTINVRLTHDGGTVSAPTAPEHEGYTFTGWDSDFSCVTEDITVTALYGNESVPTPTPTAEPTPTPTAEPTPAPTAGPTPTPTAEPTPTPTAEPTPTPSDEPTPTPSDEPTPTPSDEPYVLVGDVNGNGTVNTADAVMVLKYSASMITLDSEQLLAADTNHSGSVNTADAVLILKYAAGMIGEF